MDLRNFADRAGETRVRRICREVAIHHIHLFPALDLAIEEKRPANVVQGILQAMLASAHPSVAADRERILIFLNYVEAQIEVEKIEAEMLKLAKLLTGAGISYNRSQRMFLRAIDEAGIDQVPDPIPLDRLLL